jgi:hypothetical protein
VIATIALIAIAALLLPVIGAESAAQQREPSANQPTCRLEHRWRKLPRCTPACKSDFAKLKATISPTNFRR